MKYSLVVLLSLVAAQPLAAQEWQVARESFPFAGSQLTIRVDTDAPGTLRVIRGGPGAVRVAGRATRGFTAAGLAENEELTLSAAGDGPVDYMVTVPERVWIEVLLPGSSFGESIAGRARARTFRWGAGEAGPAGQAGAGDAAGGSVQGAAPGWLPPMNDQPSSAPLYTTLARVRAPRVVAVPELVNVRSISVRIEGTRFRVTASRPLGVQEGSSDRIEIRPAAPPMDLVLTVPRSTARFQLEVLGAPALVIDGEAVTTFCSPVTQQWLSSERRWLTFNPVAGALDCAGRSAPRHEG